MAQSRHIRIHQYVDDWLIRAKDEETCHQHNQSLLALCQELGMIVNLQKSDLVPQQVFNFVGYQYDLKQGLVRPTPEQWKALNSKIGTLLKQKQCTVRQFMSLRGLLTTTEKQVPSGRLHMRPIQWHLKANWYVPESLEKLIPISKSFRRHLQWWLQEENILVGESPHPLQLARQISTDDTSNKEWGAHLGNFTARCL